MSRRLVGIRTDDVRGVYDLAGATCGLPLVEAASSVLSKEWSSYIRSSFDRSI